MFFDSIFRIQSFFLEERSKTWSSNARSARFAQFALFALFALSEHAAQASRQS